MTSLMSEIIKTFEDYVGKCIDKDGIYPFQMVALESDDRISINALALDGGSAIKQFLDHVCNKGAKEVIMGLDRSTREGQGAPSSKTS